jgi:hypothetical protein
MHKIDDPILLGLYEYWKRKRGARRMPSRRDIDPTELLASALPYIAIAEFIEGGTRVRLRLAGSELERAFGRNLTGVSPEDVMTGGYRNFINGLLQDVRKHKAPIYSESVFRWDRENFRNTRRLYMPLGDDEVRMVFIGQTIGRRSSKGADPIAQKMELQDPMTEVVREILSD